MNISEKEMMKKRQGTSFKGYLIAKYSDLISTFGNPITNTDNYKTDVEWIINTTYGIATIYNYKDGKSYLGNDGLDVTNIYEWHVGGKNIESFICIKNELSKYLINKFG